MIIHFSTSVTGGAGSFASNIHLALLSQGAQSVLVNTEKSNSTFYASPKRSSFSVRRMYLTRRILTVLRLASPDYSLFGIEKAKFDIEYLKLSTQYEVSFIVVYWVSNFLNPKHIKEIVSTYKPKKVVFFCLDEAHLTSSCHYSGSCDFFKSGCKECKATENQVIKKIVRNRYQEKERMYEKVRPHFIFPSKSFENKFFASSFLNNATYEITPLPAVFKSEVREVETGPKENNLFRILIRSSRESRKGLSSFIRLLRQLHKVDKALLEKVHFVIIGDRYLLELEIDRYVSCEYKGFINREQLMDSYCSTDALCVTSLVDSGPIMINEAVALGNFVITTPVGVSSDLVDNTNGHIFSDFLDNVSVIEMRTALSSGFRFKMSPKFKQTNENLMFEEFSKNLFLQE